jgi:hypothetical protein
MEREGRPRPAGPGAAGARAAGAARSDHGEGVVVHAGEHDDDLVARLGGGAVAVDQRLGPRQARRGGDADRLSMFGDRALAGSMQRWLGLSPFAVQPKLAG